MPIATTSHEDRVNLTLDGSVWINFVVLYELPQTKKRGASGDCLALHPTLFPACIGHLLKLFLNKTGQLLKDD